LVRSPLRLLLLSTALLAAALFVPTVAGQRPGAAYPPPDPYRQPPSSPASYSDPSQPPYSEPYPATYGPAANQPAESPRYPTPQPASNRFPPPPPPAPPPNNSYIPPNVEPRGEIQRFPPTDSAPSYSPAPPISTAPTYSPAPTYDAPPVGPASPPPTVPPAAAAPPVNPASLFEPALKVGLVGDQPILAGDLLGQINQMLASYVGKVPEDELNEQRKLLMKQLLPIVIDTKLVYLDFLREIPPERVPEIQKRLDDQFDKARLADLMEKAKVNSAVELDALLRTYGSSLAKSKRTFAEQVLAQQMLRRNVNYEPEISHEEMLTYYREHAEDYAVPAKARWEQLEVHFDKFPNKAEAWRALAIMGNEVLRGAPLPAVARRSSQGFKASEGGQHDWTTKGSLASKVLDESLFTLPEGQLSQILEDQHGFHIIRVIERQEAGKEDFTEAQVEIKQKLIEEKVEKDRKKYLDRLRERTPVWTIFDGQVSGTDR
jgi:parvulin-like peptidyl-prolyl isomerase